MKAKLRMRERKPQYEGCFCIITICATLPRSLSEPTFLPIAGDKTSGTDSEQENAAQRKVRFSRVAEVSASLKL